MPRLPIYLLLDVSGSMSGDPISAVQSGIQSMVNVLGEDPQNLDIVYISIITFSDDVKQVVPLTELPHFDAPRLSAQGRTCLGKALEFVASCADRDVVKSTPKKKGDYPPMVFLMTDAWATDEIEKGLEEFNKIKWGNVVACGAGNAATDELLKITKNVVALETADSSSIMSFFDWVIDIVSTSSKSVGQKDADSPFDLPPPPRNMKSML